MLSFSQSLVCVLCDVREPPKVDILVTLYLFKICRDRLRLRLHGAIYRPNSFILMLRYFAYLKAVRYESMSLNKIVADKSHRVALVMSFEEVRLNSSSL